MGKTDMLNVDVEFRNDGDEALEARLYAHTPSGVSFIRVERFSSVSIFMSCCVFLYFEITSNVALIARLYSKD